MRLDAVRSVEQISIAIRNGVLALHRKGAVVGLSGGIDSSVVTALSARGLGRERVVALLMPERESSSDSLMLARLLTDSLGIEAIVEDITPILEASGCYRRRDEMIRSVIPEYRPDYKCKIVLRRGVVRVICANPRHKQRQGN